MLPEALALHQAPHEATQRALSCLYVVNCRPLLN